jgi:hypothetical protein
MIAVTMFDTAYFGNTFKWAIMAPYSRINTFSGRELSVASCKLQVARTTNEISQHGSYPHTDQTFCPLFILVVYIQTSA